MAVKISKLWGNNKFNNLTNNSKLFYIYLITNPSINTVGVLSINLPVAEAQLGLNITDIRISTKELIDNGYLYVKKYDSDVYFIVPAHFNTLAKSDSAILKITKDLEALPVRLRDFLDTLNINTLSKARIFVKPSKKEVLDYCVEQGYIVNADDFINYYQNEADKRGRSDVWINSRGKVVRDWKATLRNVWFKDENKLKASKGAPKGYEYFYVDINGHMVTPDGWKEGKPYSKDFLKSKALLKKFNE
jgi:hypothetical protein